MKTTFLRSRTTHILLLAFCLFSAICSAEGLNCQTSSKLARIIDDENESEVVKNLADIALLANKLGTYFETNSPPTQKKMLKIFYQFSTRASLLVKEFQKLSPKSYPPHLLSKAEKITDEFYAFEDEFINSTLLTNDYQDEES